MKIYGRTPQSEIDEDPVELQEVSIILDKENAKLLLQWLGEYVSNLENKIYKDHVHFNDFTHSDSKFEPDIILVSSQ